jgi:formylglycine-generating enzyme required for sulfatase activity
MIVLAVAALSGGVILFNIQHKPDRPAEPRVSDDAQGQVEPTPTPVPDIRPKQVALEPEMITIPAGKFQMGCVSGKGCNNDEFPLRTVTFDKPFAMGCNPPSAKLSH